MEEARVVQTCIYCGTRLEQEIACPEGHFMCETCKTKNTTDLIEDYCLAVTSRNPLEIAVTLMKSPGFKMHCPDHHFLVPAVLLSAYCKVTRKKKKLKGWLAVARNRAGKVPGAFCGTHGSCGAAIGTGIFLSIVTGATPLSELEWELCNLMVARSLFSMAGYGGPRCCKRVTYLSITEAARFLKERMAVKLDVPDKISCQFIHQNEEQCLKEKCPFYPVENTI